MQLEISVKMWEKDKQLSYETWTFKQEFQYSIDVKSLRECGELFIRIDEIVRELGGKPRG